jgi:predicted ATPase
MASRPRLPALALQDPDGDMKPCTCTLPHQRRRIVLTGGPGAGKTAVLELVRQSFCHHVQVLPEAASILFRGGFPRTERVADRRAAQRAIFHVQSELEQAADDHDGAAIVICDRGTVDGAAYWPGPDDFWDSLGTSREAQLARYDVVLHLRVPPVFGYNHHNPVRVESAAEAAAIDERIARAWDGHPHRHFVASTVDFVEKAQAAIRLLGDELPPCCPRPVALTPGV